MAASQRQRLLDAFAASCSEEGYAGTTVSGIIARAGVSRATFYEQFSEKEECFRAALELILAELAIAVHGVTPDNRSWPETIADRTAAALELIAAKPAFAYLAVAEYQSAGATVQAQHLACRRRLARTLDRCRDGTGSTMGQLPRSIALATIGGAEALISDEIAASRGERIAALFGDVVYILLVPYLGLDLALAEAQAAIARRHSRAEPAQGH